MNKSCGLNVTSTLALHSTGEVVAAAADKNTDENTKYSMCGLMTTHIQTATFLELISRNLVYIIIVCSLKILRFDSKTEFGPNPLSATKGINSWDKTNRNKGLNCNSRIIFSEAQIPYLSLQTYTQIL